MNKKDLRNRLEGYNATNRKSIIAFIKTLVNAVELYEDRIPFSIFYKEGFDKILVPSFIEKVNIILDEHAHIEIENPFLEENLYRDSKYLKEGILPVTVLGDDLETLERKAKNLNEFLYIKASDGNLNEVIKILGPISQEYSFGDTYGNFHVVKNESDGKYYFDGNKLEIKNKNTNYSVIFDVVFSLAPHGGKVKYEDIIKLCKQRSKPTMSKKTIQRALTGVDATLFQYVKGLKQTLDHGIALFAAMQDGKEIEFNNKR